MWVSDVIPSVCVIRLQHFRNLLPAFAPFVIFDAGRCISNALQRYNTAIAVLEYFTGNFSFFCDFFFSWFVSWLAAELTAICCSVAVLQFSKRYVHTLKILLYLYINIELFFNIPTIDFGTATLQHCNAVTPTLFELQKFPKIIHYFFVLSIFFCIFAI